MPTKILVPLDGSKVGEAALPYIESLVAKLVSSDKVEVTLIQAVSSLVHYVVVGEEAVRAPYTPQEIEQMKKKAQQYLTEAGASLRLKGAATNVRVSVGNSAEEILKAADELAVDMIAMSSHGRSGLSRLAFGSVTDKVLRGSNRPVLVVKAPKGLNNG
ncbi:MAG TPA: universal stress protein [Dehalococcoidales bacterium]|nr:universal stress protein [Dehalococcoidales bacterium]